jgi:hypothetical protein
MFLSLSNLKFLVFTLGILSYASPAFAYLDPGTGSMLLQGLIAGIAVFTSVLSIYWQKVKSFFVKQKTDISTGTNKDIDT